MSPHRKRQVLTPRKGKSWHSSNTEQYLRSCTSARSTASKSRIVPFPDAWHSVRIPVRPQPLVRILKTSSTHPLHPPRLPSILQTVASPHHIPKSSNSPDKKPCDTSKSQVRKICEGDFEIRLPITPQHQLSPLRPTPASTLLDSVLRYDAQRRNQENPCSANPPSLSRNLIHFNKC